MNLKKFLKSSRSKQFQFVSPWQIFLIIFAEIDVSITGIQARRNEVEFLNS